MTGVRALLLAGLTGASLWGAPAGAQDIVTVQSPILVIDSQRLFDGSEEGRRIAANIAEEGRALAAENRKIEAELNAREKELTERRKTMDAEAFRGLADAFDAEVEEIRRTQETKARELAQRSEEAQRRFLSQARPVLQEIMRNSGAAVMVERRSVFLSLDVIDVTEETIARIDAAAAEADDADPADPAAEPAPE